MVSLLQVAVLAANTVVLIYYGGKWIKIRSFYNKIESCEIVTLTPDSIKESAGKYVFISGTVKTLSNGITPKYSDAVSAVVQNIQRVKHQMVRIAGFWIRKQKTIEFTQCLHTKLAFINNDLKVEIRDPIWGLNQATTNDLFTGYRNITWPLSNVFHDSFKVQTETVNPFKTMLMGVHDVGIQETESLILDGSYLAGIGHLRVKNGEYSILVDLLTACDHTMLLKKLSDIRSEYAVKLLFFGTIGTVLWFMFIKRLWYEYTSSKNDNEWEEPVQR